MPERSSAPGETGRRLVDAHAHLWRRSRPGLEWLAEVPEVDHDADLAGLRAAAPAVVTDSVLVQAVNDTDETVELLGIASGANGASGASGANGASSAVAGVHAVVGWIDLAGDDPAGRLEAVRQLPGGHLLAGIRHLTHIDPDPEWLTAPATARGLAAVARAGLVFDLVVRPWQLPTAARAADAHPELNFVLDHLGQPPAEAGDPLRTWQRELRALAERPNVVAKLSGVAVRDPDREAGERLDLVLGTALEAFGPERLMFGSDWPLVRLADGYDAWLAQYLGATDALSGDERRSIDEGTALRAYGVEP